MIKKLAVAIVFLMSVGAVSAQSKIGHVDSQALMDTLPSRKDAIKKLEEFEIAGYAELQEMNTDLEQAYVIYQQKLGDMTPMLKQIEESKLQKKQQALQEREQSLQQEMQAYSQELNAPILQMVKDAVKEVAEMKKMEYILDVNVTLYAAGEDVTNEVITVLLRMDSLSN